MPAAAVAVIEALAENLPIYHLPPHPPPSGGLARDAQSQPGWPAHLVIDWPAAPEHAVMITSLFEAMEHLGPGGPPVEVRVLADDDVIPDGLLRCIPTVTAQPGTWERAEWLVAMTPDGYREWRDAMLARESARRLAVAQSKARDQGENPPDELSPGEFEQLGRELPETLIEALRGDAAGPPRARWSQPPGSRWVGYARQVPAAATGRPGRWRRGRDSTPVGDTALLSLALDPAQGAASPVPVMRDALRLCEALHHALVSRSTREGQGRGRRGSRREPSPCFIARDERGSLVVGPQHATVIALSLTEAGKSSAGSSPVESSSGRTASGDGAPRPGGPGDLVIDHIAVHAPMGFDDRALDALGPVSSAWDRKQGGLLVTPVAIGWREEFVSIPQLATARRWHSVTPFVPPRFVKRRGNTLLRQVAAELESRGIFVPVESVEVQVHAGGNLAHIDAGRFWDLWRTRQRRWAEMVSEPGGPAASGDGSIESIAPASGPAPVPASASPGPQERDSSPGDAPVIPITRSASTPEERASLPTLAAHWRHFHRILESDSRIMSAPLGLRITFAEPVSGPLSLGYGSHFGLGSFVPSPSQA